MRQGTYLNVILTVNAALLAGLLWSQIAGQPGLAQSASAQTAGADKTATGIPNAADQRQKVIESLRELNGTVSSLKKSIESGKFKVEVTNFDQARKVEVVNLDQLKK